MNNIHAYIYLYLYNDYFSNIGSKLSNIIKNNSKYDSFKYIDTQVN